MGTQHRAWQDGTRAGAESGFLVPSDSSARLIAASDGAARRAPLACAMAVATLVLLCVGTRTALAEACPYERLRAEANSTTLPDCRAYEKVSPDEKNNNDVLVSFGGLPTFFEEQSAVSGDAVTFVAHSSFAGNPAGPGLDNYLSTRGTDGWSTKGLNPAEHGGLSTAGYAGFSADLSRGLVFARDPVIAPGAAPELVNLYLHDNSTDAYQTLSVGATAPDLGGESYVGGTPDFGHVLFEDANPHTPDTPAGAPLNLYDATVGTDKLVGILPAPDEVAAPGGAVAGAGPAGSVDRAISEDGSKIFFTTPEDGQIYVRLNGSATEHISESQRSVPETPQPATYWTATSDGSAVFFTTAEQLVNGDEDSSVDLYRFDIASRTLTRLTVGAANGASVTGVVGASTDGAYVYFTATGDLTTNASGEAPKLYVWHEDEITHETRITLVGPANGMLGAPLGPSLSGNFAGGARVTPDGTRLAFISSESLTGFPNEQFLEAYLYDAVTNSLVCASCAPNGAPGTGSILVPRRDEAAPAFNDPSVPGRWLSSDGKVFFTTPDSLVPQDTNGKLDAYEYDDGVARLLSPGTSAYDSYFVEASPSGDDAFIATRGRLVSQDTDDNIDLYDARVDGGFPAVVPPAQECLEDNCQPPPSSPPAFVASGSSLVSGVGNLSTPPSLISVMKPIAKKRTAAQIRAANLAKALKVCRRGSRSRRKRCEALARKRYSKHTTNSKGKGQ
jgi:hypothetical protein